jgi:hypothetical protein
VGVVNYNEPVTYQYVAILGETKRRTSSQTGTGSQKAKKHKIEYDVRWKEEFPWHVPVYSEDGNSESGVIGLLCSTSRLHGVKQRNRMGTWTDKPCTY